MRLIVIFLALALCALPATTHAQGAASASGIYPFSYTLVGAESLEADVCPTAHLWLPEGDSQVRALLFAQQNMTEERLMQMPSFRERMEELGVALMWVTPAFSRDWSAESMAQQTFDRLIEGLCVETAHHELASVPVIPFGHSAQATMPWNFAFQNPDRTLCIISFHGDAPRTNLCGYGGANIEWGRNGNINGIPGLMIEGEYEWWEARIRPALAFRMMYPGSCISFLADMGRGHFSLSERTAAYIAQFIECAMTERMGSDGSLRPVDPTGGWLASRLEPHPQLPSGEAATDLDAYYCYPSGERPEAAPWAEYKGDRHDAFWYPNREMALETERQYAEDTGTRFQGVGIINHGRLELPAADSQTGLRVAFEPEADGLTFILHAVCTDSTRTTVMPLRRHPTHIEPVSGPVIQLNDSTFRVVRYEGGWKNPRRSLRIVMTAVAEAHGPYRATEQAFEIMLPAEIINKVE